MKGCAILNTIKNVVIINDFDYVQGGASKVAIDTANLLSTNKNINVFFFSGDSKSVSDLNENVIKVCTNTGECLKNKNKLKGMINGLYNVEAKKKLKELLKKLNPENTIVHFHGWTKCLSSSVFDIVFKMKFPNTITLHEFFSACPNGGFFNYPKNKICHLKGGSIKCVCTNCDSRNYFIKLYRILRFYIQKYYVKLNKNMKNIIYISDFSWNILKESFNSNVSASLIYNPIDLSKAKSDKVEKEDYLLYVGRVSKEKGVDIFCEAVTNCGVKAVVVGDGDQKGKLESKYPNINFVGWKSNEDVKNYMKKAKALVFPSLWYETAGLTALEARSVGTNVVVSSNTAAVEFVANKNNVFKQGSVDDLMRIIKRIDYCEEVFNTDIFNYDSYKKNILNKYEVIINESNEKN